VDKAAEAAVMVSSTPMKKVEPTTVNTAAWDFGEDDAQDAAKEGGAVDSHQEKLWREVQEKRRQEKEREEAAQREREAAAAAKCEEARLAAEAAVARAEAEKKAEEERLAAEQKAMEDAREEERQRRDSLQQTVNLDADRMTIAAGLSAFGSGGGGMSRSEFLAGVMELREEEGEGDTGGGDSGNPDKEC